MATTVELDSVPVQDTEYARPALESADLPDVNDGKAGVIHIDNGFLPVYPQLVLQDGRACLLPVEKTAFGSADGCSLCRQAADRLQYIGGSSIGEEESGRVDPVMDAHDPDIKFLAEVEEGAELPDTAECVAELADHDLVAGLQIGEHPSPLGAELLLDTVIFDELTASEILHPAKVLVTGLEVPGKEEITYLSHLILGLYAAKLQQKCNNSNGTLLVLSEVMQR